MRSLLFAATLLTAAAAAFSPLHAAAQTQPAPKTTKEALTDKAKRPPSSGQLAMRERQKACGTEWKTVKGTKAATGKTWPEFWSECNKRLKARQG